LHENTLREHLDGLLDAELVRRRRAAPQGRGRPAWLYEATDDDGVSEYAGLASALAATIARTAPDPAAAGAEAGGEWGRQIARHRPVEAVTPSRARAEDRKSTRLNSSHVKISYAVFCLKKKTPLKRE